jgi:GxxExxY protein
VKKFKHVEITDRILKAFYAVYNTLGHGFLEKVYVNALTIELEKIGLVVRHEHPMQVFYDNKLVGEYFADLVVDDCVIIEVKAVKTLTNEHEAQLLNYLKATKIETGLLLNFGTKPEIKRRAFDNSKK